MSQTLRELAAKNPDITKREDILALRPEKVYDDGRTQDTYKDETDINRIMARARNGATITHLAKHQARYGDFSDFDFFENQQKIVMGRQVFDDLPSETRKEFGNDPTKFFSFVNDPANKDRLSELLPALAQPGRQLLDVSGKTPPPRAASAAASEPQANVNPDPSPPSDPPSDPPSQGE